MELEWLDKLSVFTVDEEERLVEFSLSEVLLEELVALDLNKLFEFTRVRVPAIPTIRIATTTMVVVIVEIPLNFRFIKLGRLSVIIQEFVFMP